MSKRIEGMAFGGHLAMTGLSICGLFFHKSKWMRRFYVAGIVFHGASAIRHLSRSLK